MIYVHVKIDIRNNCIELLGSYICEFCLNKLLLPVDCCMELMESSGIESKSCLYEADYIELLESYMC